MINHRNFSIFPSLNEIRKIISIYDGDFDATLNYFEFLNLLIPEKNNFVRQSAKERHILNKKTDKLDFNVEYSLYKFFLGKLDLIRNMDFIMKDLYFTHDFNVYHLFSRLDPYHLKSISYEK